ncbi:MAG: hypothetical protein ACRERU_19335, partial [Methylococcales bacterium]
HTLKEVLKRSKLVETREGLSPVRALMCMFIMAVILTISLGTFPIEEYTYGWLKDYHHWAKSVHEGSGWGFFSLGVIGKPIVIVIIVSSLIILLILVYKATGWLITLILFIQLLDEYKQTVSSYIMIIGAFGFVFFEFAILVASVGFGRWLLVDGHFEAPKKILEPFLWFFFGILLLAIIKPAWNTTSTPDIPTETVTKPAPSETSPVTPEPTQYLRPTDLPLACPEILLSTGKPSNEQVTEILSTLNISHPSSDVACREKLKAATAEMQRNLPSLPTEARPAAMLLLAATLEKLDDQSAARSYYRDLIPLGGDYGASGVIRTQELELKDPEKLEAFYNKTLTEPALEGWFDTSGKWERTSTHQAARQGLMRLREDRFYIGLFDWLRSKSPFLITYAYLFVLLVLAAASRILVFPSILTAARLYVLSPRIASELARVKRDYAGDPAEINRRTFNIYPLNGINLRRALLRFPIEIGILILFWISFKAWEPQMALDGAQFFWASNVLEPNGNTLTAWVGLMSVLAVITPQSGNSAGKRLFAAMFGASIFALVPWYFDWPAFVLIFLMCISLATTAIQLMSIATIRR